MYAQGSCDAANPSMRTRMHMREPGRDASRPIPSPTIPSRLFRMNPLPASMAPSCAISASRVALLPMGPVDAQDIGDAQMQARSPPHPGPHRGGP